jgi:hypothetical protein
VLADVFDVNLFGHSVPPDLRAGTYSTAIWIARQDEKRVTFME